MDSLIGLVVMLGILGLVFYCCYLDGNKLEKFKEQKQREYGTDVEVCKLLLCGSSTELGLMTSGNLYVWVVNDRFCISSTSEVEKVYLDVPLEDVLGFEKLSEIQKKNISIGKAVVGGVLFGIAGAILGGFMGKSEKKEEVVLIVNYNGEEIALIFHESSYSELESLIPNKKAKSSIKTNIQGSNSNQFSQIQSNSYDELEQLAQLRDKGIITDDEFNLKKKQILGL